MKSVDSWSLDSDALWVASAFYPQHRGSLLLMRRRMAWAHAATCATDRDTRDALLASFPAGALVETVVPDDNSNRRDALLTACLMLAQFCLASHADRAVRAYTRPVVSAGREPRHQLIIVLSRADDLRTLIKASAMRGQRLVESRAPTMV